MLFLASMVAIDIDCSQWSYGALIACSTAIILRLKRICLGDWRQSVLYQVSATKAQLCRLPSRGVSCELQRNQGEGTVWSQPGFCEASQHRWRQGEITCSHLFGPCFTRSIQWLLTWFVAFSSPSNAPLTYFLLIPRCDFNWLEGGAGRRKGCVCVF